MAGMPTHFVRFGGCDFRCSWCDSKYAVDPAEVRAHAEHLSADEVMDRLDRLSPAPSWVTLSGGNPALLELGPLVDILHSCDLQVCVETQGSRWRDWLSHVDCLTVSPKPPSSGMAGSKEAIELAYFMDNANGFGKNRGGALKIVVFDDTDFEWARQIIKECPFWDAYLSAGTPSVSEWGSEVTESVSTRQVRDQVGDRYAWLCDKVVQCNDLRHARVLPQLHVVAYGHARGV